MVKFCRYLAIFIFTLVLFIFNVQEAKASFLSIGYSEKDKALSSSFAITGDNLGIEFGIIFSKRYTYYEYPYPSGNYTIVGEEETGYAYGTDILGFIDLTKNISIYGGFGVYKQEYVLITRRDNSTEDYCLPFEKHKFETGLSAGIQFIFKKFLLGLGYHELRGYNIHFCLLYE